MKPKISIVLVNYNHSQYLDERIQSLLNQTYKDFELIIIDNGSTDNSVEVISKYTTDPRIKTYFYSENIFPYKRWNNGVDLAQGEYLQIVSADDSCHPTLLEKLSKKLDSLPSANLAYSQTIDIDINGNQLPSLNIYENSLETERWSQDFIDSGKNECRYMLFHCTIANSGAVLMRRKSFIEAGKFDTQLQLSADHLLYVKILLHTDFAFISEPLNYLRRYSNTITYSTKDAVHLEEKLQVINFLLQQNVEPLESFWDKIYSPHIVWWVRLITHRNLSLSRIYKIYKLFRNISPRVNYLLIKEIFEVFKRKLKLHK